MEKWVVAAKRADFQGIGQKFHIDPVVARIIRNRDVVEESEIEKYLNGSMEDTYDPHLLKDGERAAQIIAEKIHQKKKIRIIGDYDIDGVNATYILMHGLSTCGAVVDAAIPDRMKDGYGINENLITSAIEAGVDTIITCDNGISAIAEIAFGKSQGLTIVVTDHHDIPYREEDGKREYLRSQADAIVNPKQVDCAYPFKEICGAVVAWKFVQLLYEEMDIPVEQADVFIENAAFATVGDVMELKDENRILVREGLRRIHHTTQPGLLALIQKNGIDPEQVQSYHFGFVLGPCINASGRLDTAKRSLNMLNAKTRQEAEHIAEELIQLNQSRKEMTVQGVEEAEEQIQKENIEEDKVMIIYLPECHESLAGIIAGRIRERYNKPVFVLTRAEDGGVKGSGRSIEAYSMYEEMVKCQEYFTKFGGHPMAAGLSMREEDIKPLREKMNAQSTLTEDDFIPKIVIDVPMPLEYVSMNLIRQLSVLEPFGKGNEKPVFADRNLDLLSARVIGKNRNLLKLKIRMKNLSGIEAIYFGDIEKFLAYIEEKFGNDERNALLNGEANQVTISAIYYPDINEYMGNSSIQIVIKNYC